MQLQQVNRRRTSGVPKCIMYCPTLRLVASEFIMAALTGGAMPNGSAAHGAACLPVQLEPAALTHLLVLRAIVCAVSRRRLYCGFFFKA